MAAYKPTMSYRLIYIFTIHDAQHEGYWKIGKTNFDSVNSYKQLPPNCAELNCAARDRIDQYTKTAMVEYDLQYTELARRTVTFPDGTTDTELFDDDDVHNVLYNSGFSAGSSPIPIRTANGLRCRCPLPSVQFGRSRKVARR